MPCLQSAVSGINLAISGRRCRRNILAGPLSRGPVAIEDLQRVQRRRQLPTRIIQTLSLHSESIDRAHSRVEITNRRPWPMKLFEKFRILRRIPPG